MLTRLLLTAGLAGTLAGAPCALPRAARQEPTPDVAQAQAELPDLVGLATRDARTTFSAESVQRARAVLESAPLDVAVRAAAALALGGGRAPSDLARLESMAADGKLSERQAALFALGLMGPEGSAALERALARDTADLTSALVVAWLLSAQNGAPLAVSRLESLAQASASPSSEFPSTGSPSAGPSSELAALARQALEQRGGAPAGALAPTLALYYELRWRAAQDYGLIDGQRWQRTLTRELYASEEFLERVILGSVAELPPAQVESHLTELLQAGEREICLRAAALALPEELARRARSGAWKPSSIEAWRVMLEELDRSRNERRARDFVECAYRTAPELASLAGRLLVRAGGDLPWSWVRDQLLKGTPEERTRLVEACGACGDAGLVPELADLLAERPELGLRGPGLVALAHLGQASARAQIETLVRGPAAPERDEVLRALAQGLAERADQGLAKEALRRDDLDPALRRELELGLAREGQLAERGALRESLTQGSDDAQRCRTVEALGRKPEAADLAALCALFPSTDALELNVEVARTLIRNHDPAALPILSAALWNGSWNLSVLAGGLILRAAGQQALIDELNTPPHLVEEHDLRRVGFAVGEWGGLAAVEVLARTRLEGDAELQGALLGALSAQAAEPEPIVPQHSALLTQPPKPPHSGTKKAPKPGKGRGAAGKKPHKGRG